MSRRPAAGEPTEARMSAALSAAERRLPAGMPALLAAWGPDGRLRIVANIDLDAARADLGAWAREAPAGADPLEQRAVPAGDGGDRAAGSRRGSRRRRRR